MISDQHKRTINAIHNLDAMCRRAKEPVPPYQISFLPVDVGFDLRQHDLRVDLSDHVFGGKVAFRFMRGHFEDCYHGDVAGGYHVLQDADYAVVQG